MSRSRKMSTKIKRHKDYCGVIGCINNCCVPAVKRPKLKAPASSATITVLDVLEVDICRRAILDLLPLPEVLSTEPVCIRWRDAVHHYIRGSLRARRRLRLAAPWQTHGDFWFERCLYKWGTSVVEAPCTNRSFASVAENCPNLEDLTFYGVPDPATVHIAIGKFEKLKSITFYNSPATTFPIEVDAEDSYSDNDHVENSTKINVNGLISSSLRPNLKSLRVMGFCDYQLILTTLNQLRDVTTLDLTRSSPEIMQNIHLILTTTPKLECLHLCCYDKIDLGDDILQVFERHDSLKHLILRHNSNVNDSWLDALAKGNKLISLDVSYCKDVTYEGLLVALRALGPSLEALGVAGNGQLTDEGVETIIRLCPHIMVLDLERCPAVSSGLVPFLSRLLRRRARWRLPRLRLRLRATAVPPTQPQLRNLHLDFSANNRWK